MMLAGDEVRRTQRGNNNACCQANEVSWLDWERGAANDSLRRFWKLLIDFRRRHPSLRRDAFLGGGDVRWRGCLLDAPGWGDSSSRVLAFTLSGSGVQDDDVHIVLNMRRSPRRRRRPSRGASQPCSTTVSTEPPPAAPSCWSRPPPSASRTSPRTTSSAPAAGMPRSAPTMPPSSAPAATLTLIARAES